MSDERYARALPPSDTVVELELETEPVVPEIMVGFTPAKLERTLYFPYFMDDLDDRR